jgi:GH43 family beta-xylosidase
MLTIRTAVRPGGGADPWMLQFNNAYYLLVTTGGDVKVAKSDNLVGPWPQDGTVVYKPASDQKNLWAPELHFIDDAFYIYVAWDDGDNNNHRMYVLKGSSSTDPTAPFNVNIYDTSSSLVLTPYHSS